MQLELKRLQLESGITFIIVTHDQEEALVMSDRMAVLDGGKVCQCGSPSELYENPNSRFVANFIGVSNLFEGVRSGERSVRVNGQSWWSRQTYRWCPVNRWHWWCVRNACKY